MELQLNTSLGTDDEQTKFVFIVKQVASLVGVEDGVIVKQSSREYGIIRNGILTALPVEELPFIYKDAFDKAESLPNPPKYPYALVIKDSKDE